MNFNEWLASKGLDAETVNASAALRATLESSWRAETNRTSPPPLPPTDRPPPANSQAAGNRTFTEEMNAIAKESSRIDVIQKMTTKFCMDHKFDHAKVEQAQRLCEAATADEKVDERQFRYSLEKLTLFAGPMVFSTSQPEATGKVVEAAVCRMAGLENIEKHYDAQTLEASERHFKRGLGLQDLLAVSARRNGWRGQSVRAALESKGFLRAAFDQRSDDNIVDLRADGGTSTYSLPNILGNIANKFLRVGFDAVDNTWSMISAKRSVADFKTITTAALTGSMLFRKLAPSGEIKHGTLSETTYTNKADTYAVMLGIARTDLINDDLGALSTAGRRVGRGAALKINDVFWTVFLNNSSFFTSGNSNVVTGATTTVSSAGLKLLDAKFRTQTDPDGLPLAATPKIYLVPPTMWYAGRELMNASLMVGSTTANSLLPATNIFQGAYTLLTSPYMENSSYTGYSAAASYLLADPNDLPVIEGVFVNGKDTPTVDTADADFDMLGIAMRGYIDFGFNTQEYRGGVRAAGS